MKWEARHLNWTWFLTSLLAAPSIGGIGAFALGLADPNLVEPAFSIITFSVITATTVWYLKRKNRGLGNLAWLILPFGIIVLLCLENLSGKPVPHVTKTQEEEHEIQSTDSREKGYEHNVWEIYRKEWATASPDKKTELNKRMLRWQEFMKNGLTASQAYYKAMEEDIKREAIEVVSPEPTHRSRWSWMLKATSAVLVLALVVAVIYGVASTDDAEEQEYNRITSLSERQFFQQSVKDIRTQGVNIYFGRQPPYNKERMQNVRLENNVVAVNPTWNQLVDFLKTDVTDSRSYIPGIYTCGDSAETLHNVAEKAGIRSAFVGIDLENETVGHALNAFFTVDLGWTFIDNTGRDLSDRLKFLLSLQEKDPLAGWSRDSVAYAKTGKELGFVHIAVAKSLDYTFYEDWKSRSQVFETALDQYNRDVQSFNDWSRGRVFYRGTPEAVRMQSWSNELDARKVALERDELALGPVFKPMGIVESIEIYW